MKDIQLVFEMEKKLAESRMKTFDERLVRMRLPSETEKSLAKVARKNEVSFQMAQFMEEVLCDRIEFLAQITKRIGIPVCLCENAAALARVEIERDLLKKMAAQLSSLLNC
jgi:hypothetical protein